MKRTDMNGLRLTREEVIGRARKALERKREAIARGQEILKQQTAGAQIAVS